MRNTTNQLMKMSIRKNLHCNHCLWPENEWYPHTLLKNADPWQQRGLTPPPPPKLVIFEVEALRSQEGRVSVSHLTETKRCFVVLVFCVEFQFAMCCVIRAKHKIYTCTTNTLY